MGLVVFSQGDFTAALIYWEESLAICREIGYKNVMVPCLNNLGNLATAQNKYSAAYRYYEESLVIGGEIGDKAGRVDSLLGLVNLVGSLGKEEKEEASRPVYQLKVVRLCGGVASLLNNMSYILMYPEKDYFETAIQETRIGLGEEAFNSAFAEGQAMRLEEVIDYALHIPLP